MFLVDEVDEEEGVYYGGSEFNDVKYGCYLKCFVCFSYFKNVE